MKKKGLLVVISAPSGTGKTTVCKKLREVDRSRFKFSVSCTTRSPRPGEKNGVDYYFVSREEFKKKIKNGELVEWEEVFGNYYGTLRSVLEEAIEKGDILLLDIDVKGGMNIKRLFPENTVTIFLLPPSEEELNRRLVTRGVDDEQSIRRRKKRIGEEMKLGEHFEYKIVNDKLDETVEKILKIIEEVRGNGSGYN
ncbi:MAG: guanylate kinase [Candidatus Neomarinimicrobiota bacterium]|nr:MAG: guanylate kinase [Candidatus Neomarinimicrobiota bacterium]